MAKEKKYVSHRRQIGGMGTKTACGKMVYAVKGQVKETWAGVKCGSCLRVKAAEAKAKAAKKTKKGGRR